MGKEMAQRPIFIPLKQGNRFVAAKSISFTWFPGFSLGQVQKCIHSLHDAAREVVDGPILEISSKSTVQTGADLSAFNLELRDKTGRQFTVETAFQGSKVFAGNRQYVDLYEQDSASAKKDERLQESGPLLHFKFTGEVWPLEPKTAFYDWLYLRALGQNEVLAQQLHQYVAFTDIMFNPKKSINCQARSAALYVSLKERGLLSEALSSRKQYLELITSSVDVSQPRLLG